MGSKTVKTALIVGAIATGFVAIGAVGPSGFAVSVGKGLGFTGTMAGIVGTFVTTAGTQLVLSAISQKLAPDLNIPEIGTSLQSGTTVTTKGVASFDSDISFPLCVTAIRCKLLFGSTALNSQRCWVPKESLVLNSIVLAEALKASVKEEDQSVFIT